MLTIGQVQGGLAQGIGQAMLEHTVYDPESGQMLSGSLMDYALPKAADLPDLNITLTGMPTTANPLGVKGAGQAGAMAAPQTIIIARAGCAGAAGRDPYRHARDAGTSLASNPGRQQVRKAT